MPTRTDCEGCGVKLKFYEGWASVIWPGRPTDRCMDCEYKYGLYVPLPERPPEPENLELFG